MSRVLRHPAGLLFLVALAVYTLTLDRSVSWWDSGEFIVTSYTLSVGHAPGAPFYQLVAHLFTLLSFGHPLWVAPLSNFLSALCSALTVSLLYLSAVLLLRSAGFGGRRAHLASAVAALCYLFCHSAWFSAVESEVYAMAMLCCSVEVWLLLRWREDRNPRLLLLAALTAGLGVCVHLMTLLVLPALMVAAMGRELRAAGYLRSHYVLHCSFFFLLGLTPYVIVPLRAAADPPINEMGDSFAAYVRRDGYERAPVYPRLWRDRDRANWDAWVPGDHADPSSVVDNLAYFATYQMGYMYGRYLVDNFFARRNQRYGVPVFFVLPLLLSLLGIVVLWRRRRRMLLIVGLLFLFGGPLLGVYLNHPCYEPRERDYAYLLSFSAVALLIAPGAASLLNIEFRKWRQGRTLVVAVLLLTPLLMAVGTWGDHDRSGVHSVHDIALNHLQSCDDDAILLTFGDNDTFPLWYLQLVEGRRGDISIHNLNLEGYTGVATLLAANAWQRPVYLSYYAYQQVAPYYGDRLRCEGYCWRLLPPGTPEEIVVSRVPLQRHIADSIRWHVTLGEYLPDPSASLLSVWQENTAESK